MVIDFRTVHYAWQLGVSDTRVLDLVPSSKDKAFMNLVPVGAGKACDVDSAAIIVRQRAGVWCGGVEGVVPAPGAKMATVINWRDAGANRDASRSQRGIAPACTVATICGGVGCIQFYFCFVSE